jgi:hypothetical protein
MNIDERLQVLTETAASLTGMQRENGKRLEEMRRGLQQISRSLESVHDSIVHLERTDGL